MGLHTMGGVASIVNKLESTSLETCFDRVIPSNNPSTGNPISVLSFINNAILLDTVVNSSTATGGGGTYTISGYTGAPSGAQSIGTSNHMKYIDMGAGSQGNITITATATYPHHVLGFYTATGGGGTQLVAGGTSTTSLSLTQSSSSPSVSNIWAHFGASSSSSANLVYMSTGSNGATACNSSTSMYYTDGSASTVITNTQPLYTNSAGTTHASAGWYSDGGDDYGYYNGSGSWSSTAACNF
tara:strand:+ start:806 stop:1531 length:726 start_codon:yes stop_codon:yes gene_type:complete